MRDLTAEIDDTAYWYEIEMLRSFVLGSDVNSVEEIGILGGIDRPHERVD